MIPHDFISIPLDVERMFCPLAYTALLASLASPVQPFFGAGDVLYTAGLWVVDVSIVPSGKLTKRLKKAIENCHRNSGFTH